MSSSPAAEGAGTLYVNDVRALVASVLKSSSTATGDSPYGSPSREGCGATRRPQTRRQGSNRSSLCSSPSRHRGGGNECLYSATPPLSPTPGCSANRFGKGAKCSRHGSCAALSSLREPNGAASAPSSPGVPIRGPSAVFAPVTPQKQRDHLLCRAISAHPSARKSSGATVSAPPRRSPNRCGAKGASIPSAGRSQSTLLSGIGGGYTVHMSQHPLYAGREAQARERASPSPARQKATGVQRGLAISVEANTVRRVQRGAAGGQPTVSGDATKGAPADAATASGVRATVNTGQRRAPGQRGSVIEQLAAATQAKSSRGPTADHAAGRAHTHASSARAPDARSWPRSHGEGEQQVSGSARCSGSKPLRSLRLEDVMRMRLGQAPSSVSASATDAVDKRLPKDTLVLTAREKTPGGKGSFTYGQLTAFRMPRGHTDASQPPPLPPRLSSATAGDVSVAPPSLTPPTAAPGPSSTPAPAPAAGIPAPEVSPPPSGAGILVAAAVTSAAATDTIPAPPPTAPAILGAAEAPAAHASAAGTGPSGAATASGAPLPPQPVSARELTKEEVAEAEEDRLLRDLIAASHHDHRSVWSPSSAVVDESRAPLPLARHQLKRLDSPATLSVDPTTDADLAAVMETALRLRREARGGALDGWLKPPENVLLPDPTQSAPTWKILQSVSAQEAQQAAAMAAIARPASGVSVDRAPSLGSGMTAAVPDATEDAAGGDEVPQIPDCIDYHAPFQCVLRPEYVEHDLVPAALNAEIVVDADVEDAMASRCTNRTASSAAAAAATEATAQKGDAKANTLATTTAISSGTAVKTMGAQAVLLRDPLSLLACEHLAEDTIDITARRRAYLSAVGTMRSITRGGTLFSPRTGGPASTLREASPPVEVFCELSYSAKVLLSAILYMRALGALPTLLRVGPLTEYSPVVGKENCIELVFYNPSGDEEGGPATQEEQRKRSQPTTLQESKAGSTALHDRGPVACTSTVEAVALPASRERSRSQLPARGRSSCKLGVWHRSRPSSQSGNSARGSVGGSFAEEGAAHASPSHSHPDPSSSQQQQRPSAADSRLMRALSETVMRRTSSVTFESVSAAAANVRTASPHRYSPRASFTSVAGTQRRSAEVSLMADDMLDGVLRSPGACSGERLRYETDGSRLLRSASPDGPGANAFDRRVGGQGANADESPSGSDDVHRGDADTAFGRQCRQRPSQPPQKQQSHDPARTSAFVTCVPHIRITPPSSASANIASGAAASTAATAATAYSALRRSSVIVALEDMQQLSREYGMSATARASNTPSSPRYFFPDPSKASSPLTHAKRNAPATACGPRTAAAPASGAKPASAYGPGATRFCKGERELCVVLRAVVAQKSHVYSFGKAETVHVLPPLPSRSTEDGDKPLLCEQAMQRTAELERLAVDSSNPLFKLLNSGARQREEAKIGASQWKAALLDRARRVAATERRRGSVSVNEHGVQAVDDYGDLAVAFLLSGSASQLSGSVPDIMELEALRYRIFSLLGYSASDPAGMQAVREAAARPPASAATQRSWTASTSLVVPGQARLQQHLGSFAAFQASVSPRPKAQETSSATPPGSPRAPRVSVVGVQRRPSFFEGALRRTDPLGDVISGNGGRGGHYLTEFDVQQWQKKQQSTQPQEAQALMRRRYPIYRASSVAESTLQTFFSEAKAAVAAARKQARRHGNAKLSSGRRSSRSGHMLSSRPSTDPLARHTCAEAAAAALQDAERDLLRFRPMNLNSFHRELADAVQYALDLQIQRGKEGAPHAFHI
ncbi:hypothetical protein LSCM4_05102 [Leishmania orientalis]|uniref:Uncharacterized protein n=1 Tax=Leishmania orientalis TaxID=2249476 RepID=A0A836HG45_9TRYP|nr:hypothetical protein LSCM4_05102 [Leishmania orientalis]